jgi:hypothetical protein
VNILFDGCDLDGSGGIDRYEFNIIAGVCCAQLLGRMLVYYGASIFVVPKLSQYVVEHFESVEPGGYAAKALEQAVSTLFFMMVIPLFWNQVDAGATKEARETSREIIRQHSFSGETRETALAAATVAATVAEYHRKTM